MVIGAEASGLAAADIRGDAEVMNRFGIQDTNAGLVLVFAKKDAHFWNECFYPEEARTPSDLEERRQENTRQFDLKQLSDCSGRGECQTAQDGVEEDSAEEEEEKDKDKAGDEVVKAVKGRFVVRFARRISVDKRGRLDIDS